MVFVAVVLLLFVLFFPNHLEKHKEEDAKGTKYFENTALLGHSACKADQKPKPSEEGDALKITGSGVGGH